MTSEPTNSNAGMQRTRRNIMKMGAIAVPATLATVHSASASGGGLCAIFPIPFLCPPPGKRNGPGNGRGGGGNCFLKGTKIQTATGERKIEDLAVGDLLPTMFGGLRPVQWIGRYPIKKSDPSKPWVKDALPIRIARSALGPELPHADLYVTGYHSLLIDGVLAPAATLINGTTIVRDEEREYDELEYFHVKLESHDVIYAEGVLAETLLEVTESAVNFADYLRQYGTPATDEARCAPYVYAFGGRDELKSRFRSALSPWIDLRNEADKFRDRIEELEIMISGSEALAS
jgi:Hint domain-containing protein